MQETSNYKLKKPDGTDRVRVADLNGNMDILDGKLKDIEDASKDSTEKVNQFETKVSGFEEDISELQSESTQSKTDIQQLKTDSEQAKTSIQELQGDNETNKSNITKLQGKDTEIDTKISGIESDVTSAKSDISGLKTSVKENTDKLSKITNPMIIKGTVETKEALQGIDSPEAGWIYFVGETGAKDYDEYVYTDDSKWELLGRTKIDLSNYVTFDDYASSTNYGVVKSKSAFGVFTDGNGILTLTGANEEIVGNEQDGRIALHPKNIPMFMSNYGIESKQEVPILKQTIGYESRNLFDFDAWKQYNKNATSGTINISDGKIKFTVTANETNTVFSSALYNNNLIINVIPNAEYALSIDTSFSDNSIRTTAYVYTTDSDYTRLDYTEQGRVTKYFTTKSNTIALGFGLYGAPNSTSELKNITLQLANAQTDGAYHPYTPTVNDRLLSLESPNIPVLKKKTITGKTTVNGNLSLYPLTTANAIVLAVIEVENINYASLVCSAYAGGTSTWIAHVISDIAPHPEITNQDMSVIVYYLEIPSGYKIPEDTTVSSDEPEDDEGLSPQASYTNEEPANYEE